MPPCPTFVLDINSDIQRVLRRLNGQPVFDAHKQLVDEAADKDFSALQLGKEAFAEILARSFVAMSRVNHVKKKRQSGGAKLDL